MFVEHSSHAINNNEQYLICIGDDNQQVSAGGTHMRLAMNSMGQSTSSSDGTDKLAASRTDENSRLVNNEQQKMKINRKNRWEKTENLQRY